MAKQSGYEGFSAEERAAMKDLAAEHKAASSKRTTAAEKLAIAADECRKVIAEMPPEDRTIAEALDRIVTENAPDLSAKTWYGMPAYARDGKVIVFFKPAAKFKVRYAEVGFNEHAQLDDGVIWPTAFAVLEVTKAVEKQLTELVKRAAR